MVNPMIFTHLTREFYLIKLERGRGNKMVVRREGRFLILQHTKKLFSARRRALVDL